MSGTPEIDIEQFAAARSEGTVVDVREPYEFVAGHVEDALLVPMGSSRHACTSSTEPGRST